MEVPIGRHEGSNFESLCDLKRQVLSLIDECSKSLVKIPAFGGGRGKLWIEKAGSKYDRKTYARIHKIEPYR